MSAQFQQYELRTDEGAVLLVDQVADRVIVQHSGPNHGAARLTPQEGHELARQVEAASAAAMSFKPAEPETLGALNTSPAMDGILTQLGPAGIAAIVAQAVASMTPEQLAAIRGEPAPAPAATQEAWPQA